MRIIACLLIALAFTACRRVNTEDEFIFIGDPWSGGLYTNPDYKK